jgi:signal transduction histidine kinase
VVRQARSGWDGSQVSYTDSQILDHDSLIGQASEDGRPHVDDVRTNLAIPLRAGQRVIGVLKLQAYQNDEISEADVSALQSLADQVSVAIQNAQTYAVERDTVERLHRLAQTRAQSLGSMSRELATSLNSIIGFSRLILKGVDGPLTEQQRSDVSVINRSGQHLLGLLDDILELIDLESSEKPLEKTSVELCEVMAHVLDKVSTVAEDRSIALHFECPANLPSLQADGVRLCQVLTHLISSVLETAEGDVVMVGARLGDASGHQVMVSVTSDLEVPCLDGLEGIEGCVEDLSDNGIGWDGTESSIRLMLSKRIIELHGGHLWVGGTPSRQVTFVFTLPIAEGCSLVGADSRIGEQAEGIR